jgi:hypothetical protein
MNALDLLEWQERRCGACLREMEGWRLRHLDHHHASGLVRGWLCAGCNMSEGHGNVPSWLPPEVRERWDWEWYRRNPPARRAGLLLPYREPLEPGMSWKRYDELRLAPIYYDRRADRAAAAIIGAKLLG